MPKGAENLPPLPELPPIWDEMSGEELIELGTHTQNPFVIRLGRDKKFIEEFGPVLDEEPEV